METTLAHHLIRLADSYAAATGMSLSTLGEKASGDWRFFGKLRASHVNFRVRTYDRAVAWFGTHWPADLAWPHDVPRPAAPGAEAAGSPPSSVPDGEPAAMSPGGDP